MNLIQIDDWHDYRRDGDQFLHTALEAYKKQKQAFSTETLYNLTCMAIEKFIMAYLMKNGDMADNHTMKDMIHSVERHIELNPELVEKLLFLDGFQDLCTLEKYESRVPTKEDIMAILAIGEELRNELVPYLEDSPTVDTVH